VDGAGILVLGSAQRRPAAANVLQFQIKSQKVKCRCNPLSCNGCDARPTKFKVREPAGLSPLPSLSLLIIGDGGPRVVDPAAEEVHSWMVLEILVVLGNAAAKYAILISNKLNLKCHCNPLSAAVMLVHQVA